MTRKARRKLFWLSIAAFLIIAPPVILFSTGWRITKNFELKRTGGLFVAVPESGTEVYLDGRLVKKTNFLQSGVFIQDLSPRPYSILVAKDGFWPWAKQIDVAESAVAESKALMMSQNISGKVLLNGPLFNVFALPEENLLISEEQKNGSFTLTFYLPSSDEFLSASGKKTKSLLAGKEKLKTFVWKDGRVVLFFENHAAVEVNFDFRNRSVAAKPSTEEVDKDLPALPHHISFDRQKRARLWYQDRQLWIEWVSDAPPPYYLTEKKELIFETKSEIRNASFLPGRNDVAVVAMENGVFAREIDGRGVRNFQPIYKGKSPNFARLGNDLYILDQGALSKIEF